jgi:hypothetical protein
VFGFSGSEILLIAVIALILFGNDKLPENIKKMIKLKSRKPISINLIPVLMIARRTSGKKTKT